MIDSILQRLGLVRIKTMGADRSSKWPALREDFLKGRKCSVCNGTKKLEAHHIQPFHTNPELELEPSNLMALCEGNPNLNCHLMFGHLGSFLSINPEAITDCVLWNSKIQTRR